MDYQELDLKTKSFKAQRVRLTLILFGCAILILALNILPSLLAMATGAYSFLMMFSVAVIIFLPMIQNSIYAMFLCAIRNEKFTKADWRYSFSKLGYHVGIYLALYFLQLGINAILQTIVSFIPIPVVYSILTIFLNVFMICLGVYVAFAIFQGVKGVFAIIQGSLRMMMKHWKNVLFFALPYLIWTLIINLTYNLWMADWFGSASQSVEKMVDIVVNSPIMVLLLVMLIGLNIIQYIGMAIFQYKMFLAYGILFDQDYKDVFPIIEKRKVQGKIIDIRK